MRLGGKRGLGCRALWGWVLVLAVSGVTRLTGVSEAPTPTPSSVLASRGGLCNCPGAGGALVERCPGVSDLRDPTPPRGTARQEGGGQARDPLDGAVVTWGTSGAALGVGVL